MRVSQCVGCHAFPCSDVKHECYVVPGVSVKPETVSIVMVSEAAPENADDYYYAKGNSLFQQTTVQGSMRREQTRRRLRTSRTGACISPRL